MTALLMTVLAGNGQAMTAEEVHAAIPPALRPTLGKTMTELESMVTLTVAVRGGTTTRPTYAIRRPGRS